MPPPSSFLGAVAFYIFAFLNWFLYIGLAIRSGAFFKKNTEQDKLQLAIAQDQFWNLSKSPFPNFFHNFYELRNGLKLHYIINKDDPMLQRRPTGQENLAILIHGFPDSSMEWRHMLQTGAASELQDAIIVCVDLPGFGGSDSFDHYGPDTVLESVAEFVIAMRELYLDDGTESAAYVEQKTYVVAHDWGCVIGFRLAAEASAIADRFILMNAPHPELALANRDRIIKSAQKIFKQFQKSPWQNRGCLSKALKTLKPLLIQLLLFGYIFVFHLPAVMVKYLGTGGNFAFLRGAHRGAHGKHKEEFKGQESMACTLGPSLEECKTKIQASDPDLMYGKTVTIRAQSPGEAFMQQTSYYRDGAAFDHWNKSIEIIADLHSIELNNAHGSPLRRRSSSGSSALFDSHYKGSLHAPTTILWGQKDIACSQALCLDGIGDYLPRDSEVVLLPKTGHWTPVEKESREVLAKVLEWFVVQGNVVGDVGGMVKELYEGATVLVKK